VAEIAPLRGLRYADAAGSLADLLSPPYDVITDAERDRLLRRSPFNFVRVEFPKPDGEPYLGAAATLAAWRTKGALGEDAVPALYVHDHEFIANGARLRRRGFHCALRLHPLDEGVVLPHELTFPKARADRLALLRATRTNTSAVFALFADDRGEIAAALARSIASGAAPTVAEVEVGDERHRLWAVTDRDSIAEIRDALASRRVYIADGHHRYETALNYLAERGESDAPARYTLAYLCALEDPGLRIFGTHRIVRPAGALDRAIERSFERVPIDAGALRDSRPGIVVARDGTLTELRLRDEADISALRPAWRQLPVAQAEELLLRKAREAGAEVDYEHDLEAAIAAAQRGATAVLLRAVDPETLRRVADAGERLPQKTTYFYPKVPAGLVVRTLG